MFTGTINMYGVQNKWCFVPGCKNTTRSSPNKVFLTIPKDFKLKVKWFKASRRDVYKSKSTFYCCEDHFNLEEDMDNYMHYKMMRGKIILKAGVIPHIFDCQTDRKRASSAPVRSVPLKRERKRLVEEALMHEIQKKMYVEQKYVPTDPDQSIHQPSTSSQSAQVRIEESEYAVEDVTGIRVNVRSVGVQGKPSYRSKYVMCKMKAEVCDTASSPAKFLIPKNVATSPICVSKVKKILYPWPNTSKKSEEFECSSSYVPSSDSDLTGMMLLEDKKHEQEKTLNVTRILVAKKPKSYIGVPNSWFPYLIDLICVKTKLSKDNIFLTSMKIKLNDSLARLGDLFGMTTPNASKIFKNTLLQIEYYLQTLIYWTEKTKIKQLLPIAFRARYSNVQSIIDCLEIQIQKPSDPIKQALTWSEYKKYNTLKYLISSTPDGFINFISNGYGGRISDSLLVEESGYLQIVPPGCGVMADRGFKDIAKLLHSNNCQLIRPPSVSSVVKPTKAEVLESKRIASLRIHIERVIRRI